MNTDHFFDSYYKNADINSILIMDIEGKVLDINRAFTKNFGYQNDEIVGNNFSILFDNEDKKANKPRLELEEVLSTGQAHDENYVMDNKGRPVWCTGESLLISTTEGEKYIVKDIINLQSKRQLQLFLKETEELLERIFESSTDIPMIIFDGSLKVQRVNPAFLKLFELDEVPLAGCRVTEINHPFWNQAELKNELRNIIVSNEPLKNKEFKFRTLSGESKTIVLDSKVIESQKNPWKKIFIIIQDVTNIHNRHSKSMEMND